MPEEKSNSLNEKTRLLKAIAILEEKRGELGNEITDIAIAPLREKLDKLEDTSNANRKKLPYSALFSLPCLRCMKL